MKKEFLGFIFWVIILLYLLSGCGNFSTPVPASLPTSATSTNTPTREAAPTSIPSPTATPTLNLPVLPGTPVPMPNEPITSDNVDRLQQLAMWGKGRIEQLVYSPDGKLLAVGTTAGIWLYNAETLELERFIQTESEVLTMAFMPDSTVLTAHLEGNVKGQGGKTIMRWSVNTGERVGQWEVGVRNLWRVVFAPDGKTLASVLEDGQVGLWEIESGRLLVTLGVDSDPLYLISALTFSPDSRLLASEAPDHTIRLWEVETGNILKTLPGHFDSQRRVTHLTFSPDGKLLASGAEDYNVKLWTVESGELLYTLTGHTLPIQSLTFSPDGGFLASGAKDNVIRLWNVIDGQSLHTLTVDDINWVTSLAFSQDGLFLASGGWDKAVRLWNRKEGVLQSVLGGYTKLITDLEISSDGAVYVSNATDKEIQILNLKDGQIEGTLNGYTDGVGKLSLSANGQILASGEKWSFDIWIWDVTTGRLLKKIENVHGAGTSAIPALSPDGQTVASSENKVYDVQTGDEKLFLRGYEFKSLNFSPDGSNLVTPTSSNNIIILWDIDTGEILIDSIVGSIYPGESIPFSPDGKTLATGLWDGTIGFWAVDTGEKLYELEGHPDDEIISLAFAPKFTDEEIDDNVLLVSSGRGGGTETPTIKFWEIGSGRLLRTLKMHSASFVRFTPDGTMLILGLWDGTIELWGISPE